MELSEHLLNGLLDPVYLRKSMKYIRHIGLNDADPCKVLMEVVGILGDRTLIMAV